ncbi:MAG TPA: DUF952 domain-containing protein [Rhodospirillaceae bacterium]|nr:DUF952 domain-containing protein [Rhodospirillaceae bacterium]
MVESSPCVGICSLDGNICIGCGRSLDEIAEAGRSLRTVIYHICHKTEWLAAQSQGEYRGSSQDAADGFIHFSTKHQVIESAAKHRAGQSNLMLLACDAGRLGTALRWEAARNGQLFPHLYGALPLSAVIACDDLPLVDGGHQFPPLDHERC